MIPLTSVPQVLDAVARLIADSGLSHRALAARIGVNHNQVDRWSTGRGVISLHSLIALASDRRYVLALVPTREPSTTHLGPANGSGLTRCCALPRFELPRADRMATDAPVTCRGRRSVLIPDTWPMVGQV